MDFQTWCDGHEERHDRIDGLLKELREDIKTLRDELANRPPLWATIAITILAAAVGWFAK